MRVPFQWPRAPPLPYPQLNVDKVGASRPPGLFRDADPPPRARLQKEGPGRRGRGPEGNLPPRAAFGRLRFRDQLLPSPQVMGMLLLPTGEGGAVRTGGQGSAGRGRGRAGAGAGAVGPNSPRTRPGGSARRRACSARAPRRVCVPAFAFLPRRSCGRSERRTPAEPQPLRQARPPRVAAPRSGAEVRAPPGRGASPSRARGEREGGGRRPRPPAARALPLVSPPPCSIPHALQGSQAG